MWVAWAQRAERESRSRRRVRRRMGKPPNGKWKMEDGKNNPADNISKKRVKCK
jgi:hypothetical protein